jgi:hypothetical protein
MEVFCDGSADRSRESDLCVSLGGDFGFGGDVFGAGGAVAKGDGDAVAGAEDGDASGLSANYWDGSACGAVDFEGVRAVAGSLVLGFGGDYGGESCAGGGAGTNKANGGGLGALGTGKWLSMVGWSLIVRLSFPRLMRLGNC